MYDNEDSVCGIIYNGVPYYFRKNLQGDIIEIVDKDAKRVARYSYDAWGACTVVSASNVIGYANPFRYRGYYYDIENKLYYLNSRYYDPAVGRFINADESKYSVTYLNALYTNLFIYCGNNAVNKTDHIGCASTRLVGVGLQLELNVSWRTYGLELVWYFEASVRNWRAWYIPYVYLYGGGGLSADLTSIISKITKNPSLVFNPKSLTSASASISIFAIFGYSNFRNPSSYEGWFSGASVTVWNVKAYTAWCGTCFVVGAGLSTSKFSASTGGTYYALSSTIFNGLSNIYYSVAQKGRTLG